MMRAAFYTKQGAARDVLQIGDLPDPSPGPGEVRVRLRASGVNPSDWKTRKGGVRAMVAPLVVPHSDGAGDIDAVGDGVPRSRVGERVWLWNGQWKRAFGTAAQYIAVPSSQAVLLPNHIDYAAGACLGIPAMTALQAVRLASVSSGSIVLISAGAGAVAHYAIQWACARGARVITTVSGDAKALHARAAGAAETINYRTEDVGERVQSLTDGRGVDAFIDMDLAANAHLIPKVVCAHGIVVVYGLSAAEVALPAAWMMQNSVMLKLFLVYELAREDRMACLVELDVALKADALAHAIGRRLPLDRIIEAHEAVERGEVIGNVVLDID